MTDHTQAIANLIYSYAELLDTGDSAALGALFDGAVVRVAGSDHEMRGAEDIQSLIEHTVQMYDGIPRTKHLITNLIVEIDDDERSATARSYYVALQAHPNLPLQPILAGRWHDTLELRQGRWRFVDRIIHNDLVGDISLHLKRSQR